MDESETFQADRRGPDAGLMQGMKRLKGLGQHTRKIFGRDGFPPGQQMAECVALDAFPHQVASPPMHAGVEHAPKARILNVGGCFSRLQKPGNLGRTRSMRLTRELNHDRSPQGIGRFHATLGGTGEHAVGHPVLADLQLGFPAREEKVGLIKGQVAVDHQPPGQGHGIVAMGTARLAPALDHPFELGRGEQPMALNGVEDGLNDNGHDSPREKWVTPST